MAAREEFEKEYNWIDKREQPMFLSMKYIQWLEKAWQEQQKKIDELKSLNPDVPCPVCGEKKGYSEQKRYPDDNSGVVNFYGNPVMTWIQCKNCKGTGTVPLTKAQEYRIKELEEKLTEVMR